MKEGMKGLFKSKKFLAAIGTIVTMILAQVVSEDTAALVDKIFGIGIAYIGGQGIVDAFKRNG